MHAFDPLDWIHQWDDFEMMMYARHDVDEPGIFMQVSRRLQREGAEEWEILYDRKIADVPEGIAEMPGTDAWEERVLRRHLTDHPQLVNEEKQHLAEFLANRDGRA
ncbi:hypothetical protein SAMN05421543_101318 [Alicyclobacillus macrosporangiidus]|uniref:Uncharacterized protein n=2 Tax=Alicyclobacillus macrosporangiidus TaxID=392015 RepID=A0A1I7FKW4_9BACL|nr:hypothetical protein SAMN05421543_101318 [Alicyclobacillus macrosporangiidus]